MNTGTEPAPGNLHNKRMWTLTYTSHYITNPCTAYTAATLLCPMSPTPTMA